MNKNYKKYAVGAALGVSLFLPLLAMAQPIITSPTDISRIIAAILNWLTGIIFIISLIMLFYAAFLYMTAGASEAALGKSKTVLIYAVIGISVAILAFSFRPFLETFFRGAF